MESSKKKLYSFCAEGRPIVFVDASGLAHGMPRTNSYARRGQRCWGKQNRGAKGRHVIGALLGKALLTLVLASGTVNTNVFNAWPPSLI